MAVYSNAFASYLNEPTCSCEHMWITKVSLPMLCFEYPMDTLATSTAAVLWFHTGFMTENEEQ